MAFPPIDTSIARPSSGIASPPHHRVRSRNQSISSDRPSTIGQHSLMSPPLSVSPEAGFIAASAASQIVTNDHDSHADTWYDQHGIEQSGETVLVSPAALLLVNNFLDQLLFNFLSLSGSTTLSTLRPAVSEVLKPKLAKDAINQADEELREYLGGGDDEDILQPSATSPRDWDLELVWKRTRLRCMVYSSLGDMEEEDEDYYMEQEHLEGGDETLGETVSPAVAIFLTSILEFMGEQALVVAGQAAYHRMRVKHEKEMKEGAKSPVDLAERVVVEDLDMERVALDRTLGRLWRAWKKRIRSPVFGNVDQPSRPRSRDSSKTSPVGHLRHPSLDPESSIPQAVEEKADEHELDTPADQTPQQETADGEPLEEYLLAAAIPLPIGDNDVDEIEVPGLASYSDDEGGEEEEEEDEPLPVRPKSLMIFPHAGRADLPTPTVSQPHTPIVASRKRSNSLPTPATSPYRSPANREAVGPTVAPLPEEISEPTASAPRDISTEKLGRDDVEEEQVAATEATTEEANLHGDEDAVEEPEAESDKAQQGTANRLSAIVASAAAVGTAALTGLAAIAGGADVKTEVDLDEEEEDVIEDFTEEPEILTSSRISVSGRSSSPTSSEHGRPKSMNPGLPARSASVHSLRLVDVTGPRSPTTRSRGSSIHEPEQMSHPPHLSRANSVATPPIEEEDRKAGEPAGTARGSLSHPLQLVKSNTSESISEAEELEETAAVTPVTPATPKVQPQPVSAPGMRPDPFSKPVEAERSPSDAIFGSAVRQTPPSPRSPAKAQTKVTILSSSTSNGTFFIDEAKPEVPTKPVQNKVPSPTIPARNTNRQSPIIPQSSSVGSISVDRPAGRKESPEPVRPSQERSVSSRNLHTSASSTSSSANKMKTTRASQESSATRPEDVARNFEELIQSDQTIQYTLTPESMRDIDSARSVADGSPLIPVKSRKSEDTRQVNGSRSRSSSVAARPADMKRSASISRATGLSSHPVEAPQANGKLAGPVPRAPPVSMQNRARGSGPQARDARVPRESLADFAEFIRATGPSGDFNPAPIGRGPSVARSSSGPVPASMSNGNMSASRLSTGARNRLQARDAAVDYKDDNSDLIDFIRRGPPTSNNPRIPRTVAPFRTTMDSDQMAGAVGGRAVDASLPDIRNSQATNITDVSMPSIQSSVNSQSALLGRNKPLPQQTANQFDEEDMMPKRKTRRVKDPYAIDFSDEEDDEFEDLPKRNQPKEESLIDFLRNAPPPPQTSPVPLDIPQTQGKQRLPKKASAPSLIARFTRHSSSGSNSLKSPTVPSRAPVESRSVSSRAGTAVAGGSGRNYIPIQLGFGGGSSNAAQNSSAYTPPATSGSSAMPASAAASGSGRRVIMKKFEPRDAVSAPSREVNDLADFLRNSEPPPSMMVDAYPAQQQEEPNGFARVFGRRKKSAVA